MRWKTDSGQKKKQINILEPSVGMGAFIPQFLRLIDNVESATFDLVDISKVVINNLKILLKYLKMIL